MKPVTASQVAKHYGCKNLKEVSEISEVSSTTLCHWYHEKRNLFEVVVLGSVAIKQEDARREFKDEA